MFGLLIYYFWELVVIKVGAGGSRNKVGYGNLKYIYLVQVWVVHFSREVMPKFWYNFL
jgi:hypothetical protein